MLKVKELAPISHLLLLFCFGTHLGSFEEFRGASLIKLYG
jgi:hypothetical protein